MSTLLSAPFGIEHARRQRGGFRSGTDLLALGQDALLLRQACGQPLQLKLKRRGGTRIRPRAGGCPARAALTNARPLAAPLKLSRRSLPPLVVRGLPPQMLLTLHLCTCQRLLQTAAQVAVVALQASGGRQRLHQGRRGRLRRRTRRMALQALEPNVNPN